MNSMNHVVSHGIITEMSRLSNNQMDEIIVLSKEEFHALNLKR